MPVCCSVLWRVAACCSVLQFVAVCCSVLQCVAVCCSACREALYVCLTWPIHIWDMIHSCDVTHSYVWHDLFPGVTRLIYMGVMMNLYVWHNSYNAVSLKNSAEGRCIASFSVLQCVAVFCRVYQCVLQCVAVCICDLTHTMQVHLGTVRKVAAPDRCVRYSR